MKVRLVPLAVLFALLAAAPARAEIREVTQADPAGDASVSLGVIARSTCGR